MTSPLHFYLLMRCLICHNERYIINNKPLPSSGHRIMVNIHKRHLCDPGSIPGVLVALIISQNVNTLEQTAVIRTRNKVIS